MSVRTKQQAASKRRRAIWLAGGVALAALVVVVAAGLRAAAVRSAQSQRLVGRWLRPDGGYVLEIRAARRDGQLEAAYFNPRPIHVAQANHRRDGGEVAVFVELRDVNYPGSTYTLRYVPAQDRLMGEYFQALQR